MIKAVEVINAQGRTIFQIWLMGEIVAELSEDDVEGDPPAPDPARN